MADKKTLPDRQSLKQAAANIPAAFRLAKNGMYAKLFTIQAEGYR